LNTASNTRLRLNYSSWARPRSHWSASGPRNQHTAFRTKTHQHAQQKFARLATCALHWSDRWPTPVRTVTPVRPVTPIRPVDRAGQAGDVATQQTFQGASVTPLGPGTETPPNSTCKEEESYTKPSKTTPKLPRTDQHQLNPKTHEPSNSPETNPTKGSHRSDRSRAPVTLVMPGQLGMNRARGSTPPNPTPDLPIQSTDSHKTLGIIGTSHGHSIAKLWSTKTR
jgi:hypothetical protein